MSCFSADLECLLTVASADSDAEFVPRDLALMVDGEGGIRVMDAAGWQTDALQIESGARTLFRISREGRRVRVEGRCGGQVETREEPAARATRCRPRAVVPPERRLAAGT